MASKEIESFVLKFQNLQFAGFKALLTLEDDNGEAFVTLKADLGSLTPPSFYHWYYCDPRPPVRRPPAYF